MASITLWEMAVLFARGHLRARGAVEAAIRRIIQAAGVIVKEITPEVAALATQFGEDSLPDPADRLIAATARAEALTLVTRDERLRASALVRTIW